MWTMPLGALLAVVAGTAVYCLHVPTYEASALVLIESQRPFIAFEDSPAERNADRYVETQIELLQSPYVLTRVVGRKTIAAIHELRQQIDPLKYLQQHLKVSQVGKSELYNLTCSWSSGSDAATIANSIVAEYLLMQDNDYQERSRFVVKVLEEEREVRIQRIKELRKKVVDLSKEVTGKDPFGQGAIIDADRALSPIAAIYQSSNEVEVEATVLKAELQALQESPVLDQDLAVEAGLLDLEISNRPEIRDLEARIAAANQRLIDSRSVVKQPETDSAYRRLVDQASQAKRQLDSLREGIRKQLLEARLQQRKAEHHQLIATKMQELSTLEQKRTLFSEKLSAALKDLKLGSAQSVELEFAKAELRREESVFETIASRKLALQTESRAPARVTQKHSATVPLQALDPIPYKLLLVACIAALGLPLGLVVGAESLIRRVSSSEQLAEETLLPVLGEVARFPVKRVRGNQNLLPLRQQRETFIFAESIESLRTNLMLKEHVGGKGQRAVIAICSAASGEGKTSIAAHLALSIAETTKQPTLTIDADLRAPDIAPFFGAPSHPGIAEILEADVPLKDAIHRIGETFAYVLPAGKLRSSPHQIIHGERIERLLTGLREKFHTIIIDTPPVLGASESLVYAKAADLVVFCSLADVSRLKQVHVAVERLQSTGANVVGTVLSGITVNRYVSNYGSYAYQQPT